MIIALRDDYLGQFAAWAGDLLWADRPTIVKPLNPQQLADAIRMPAAQVGVSVDEDLIRRLTDRMSARGERPKSTSRSPEAPILPEISHALRFAWLAATERQPQGIRLLSLADYARTGGITRAVASTAEAIYRKAPAAGQTEIKRLFVHRLLSITDDGRVVRRLLPLFEAGSMASRECLDALSAARLITIRDGRVQIAQETLSDMWPRLRDWLHEERAGVLVDSRIEEEAEKWNATKRKHRLRRGYLLGGRSLTDARSWIADPDHLARLTPTQCAFCTASKRRRRALRGLGVVVVTILVMAGITITSLGRIAQVQAAEKARQTRLAQAKGLIAEADAIRDSDPAVRCSSTSRRPSWAGPRRPTRSKRAWGRRLTTEPHSCRTSPTRRT